MNASKRLLPASDRQGHDAEYLGCGKKLQCHHDQGPGFSFECPLHVGSSLLPAEGHQAYCTPYQDYCKKRQHKHGLA